MSDLAFCISFLDKTNKELDSIIKKLEKLQRYFSDNFDNVVRVRNSELEFLQKEFFNDDTSFPSVIKQIYLSELPLQGSEFSENFQELSKSMKEIEDSLKKTDANRIKLLEMFKKFNTDLDAKEEQLKLKVNALEARIDDYNRRIDELNRGLGFLMNIFSMKKIQKEKETYIKARRKIVKDINDIRNSWKEKEKSITKELEQLKDAWNIPQTEFSLISEKLDYLKANREDIISKATFSATMKKLRGDEDFLIKLIGNDRPACPVTCSRCGSDNKSNMFFCFYCGARFSEDRRDIQGSLVEVGELNAVYESILEGVKETVSFLALLKGIKTGVEAIRKSYASVKKTQDTYSSLKKLKISIPEVSKDIPGHISHLDNQLKIEFKNLHPKIFFEQFKVYTQKLFTENKIKGFFEAMGEELNKTTKAQW